MQIQYIFLKKILNSASPSVGLLHLQNIKILILVFEA